VKSVWEREKEEEVVVRCERVYARLKVGSKGGRKEG